MFDEFNKRHKDASVKLTIYAVGFRLIRKKGLKRGLVYFEHKIQQKELPDTKENKDELDGF